MKCKECNNCKLEQQNDYMCTWVMPHFIIEDINNDCKVSKLKAELSKDKYFKEVEKIFEDTFKTMGYKKAKIVIVAKDKDEAIAFYKQIIGDENIECDTTALNLIYEHPIYKVSFMKEYTVGCGQRCNFIYAKEEVINSEWFKSVTKSMHCMGIEKIGT